MEHTEFHTDHAPLPNPADAALVAGLQAGEEHAFTTIYDRYYDRVFYFARRYVPLADAEDITAEAFLTLWNKRTDFDRLDAIAQFLFVITRNRCYNSIKRAGYRHRYTSEMSLLLQTEAADNFYFEQQVRQELVRLLEAQVNRLPEKVRTVFLLSFEQGLMPTEIARQLGISVQTVKNQKLSAIRFLREALANHPLEAVLLLLTELGNNFYQA